MHMFLCLAALVACAAAVCQDGTDNVLNITNSGAAGIGFQFNGIQLLTYDDAHEPSCQAAFEGLVTVPGYVYVKKTGSITVPSGVTKAALRSAQVDFSLGKHMSNGGVDMICTNGVISIGGIQEDICVQHFCGAFGYAACDFLAAHAGQGPVAVSSLPSDAFNPNHLALPGILLELLGPLLDGRWATAGSLRFGAKGMGGGRADPVHAHLNA